MVKKEPELGLGVMDAVNGIVGSKAPASAGEKPKKVTAETVQTLSAAALLDRMRTPGC